MTIEIPEYRLSRARRLATQSRHGLVAPQDRPAPEVWSSIDRPKVVPGQVGWQAEARQTGGLEEELRRRVTSSTLTERLLAHLDAQRQHYEQLAEGDSDAAEFDEGTWETATSFVTRGAVRICDQSGREIDVPTLFPTHDGGIDIEWSYRGRGLSIYIPMGATALSSYYGKDAYGAIIQGTFRVSEDNAYHTLIWLTL